MKPMNTTAELLSLIWQAVDIIRNNDGEADANWITKQTIAVCKEIEKQALEKQ
jgi:hypothetical protein